MRDGKPERRREERRPGRWAVVNLVVAMLLVVAVAVLRMRAGLADAVGLALLAGTGVLALLLAGLLFGSFLRR